MITLYHGTHCDFERFDIVCAQPYNVGLHFGTRKAAQERIDYLRERGVNGGFHLIKCRLDICRPFRMNDVFGRSFAMILDALQREIGRATPRKSPLRTEIATLIAEYMSIEDDPSRAPGTEAYEVYCRRLNADIIRLFTALGYDGIVYVNELEDAASKEDSYVVFNESQIRVVEKFAA